MASTPPSAWAHTTPSGPPGCSVLAAPSNLLENIINKTKENGLTLEKLALKDELFAVAEQSGIKRTSKKTKENNRKQQKI